MKPSLLKVALSIIITILKKIDRKFQYYYTVSNMIDSIGRQLGINLAYLELELAQSPVELEILQKINLVSQTFKNFKRAGWEGFEAEFSEGYKVATEEISRNQEGLAEDAKLRQFDDETPKLDGGP